MKLFIDTREQHPLEFNHEYITQIIRKKLDVGDYMAVTEDGYLFPFSFERKSIGDVFGTLSQGYKRFKKEIERAKTSKIFLIIIIEGTLTDVLKGYERCYRTGDEVCQQLFTIMVRHLVPFVCCKNRFEASRFITEFFLALGREHINLKKTNVK